MNAANQDGNGQSATFGMEKGNEMRETITLTNGKEVEPGTWLDGWHGWTNSYRIIDIAVGHGMTLDPEEQAAVEWYRNSGESDSGASDEELDKLELVTGQRGLSDKATEYMEEMLPDGWVLRWDDGLALIPDWVDCAADGNGCETGVDSEGNEIVTKRCPDHGCQGHHDDDHTLTRAGIGEPTYCDGSCRG